MSNYTIISPPSATPSSHSSPRCHFCITVERIFAEVNLTVTWKGERDARERESAGEGSRNAVIKKKNMKKRSRRKRERDVKARNLFAALRSYRDDIFTLNYIYNRLFHSRFSPLSFPFLCCTNVTHYSHSHLESLGAHTHWRHIARGHVSRASRESAVCVYRGDIGLTRADQRLTVRRTPLSHQDYFVFTLIMWRHGYTARPTTGRRRRPSVAERGRVRPKARRRRTWRCVQSADQSPVVSLRILFVTVAPIARSRSVPRSRCAIVRRVASFILLRLFRNK